MRTASVARFASLFILAPVVGCDTASGPAAVKMQAMSLANSEWS